MLGVTASPSCQQRPRPPPQTHTPSPPATGDAALAAAHGLHAVVGRCATDAAAPHRQHRQTIVRQVVQQWKPCTEPEPLMEVGVGVHRHMTTWPTRRRRRYWPRQPVASHDTALPVRVTRVAAVWRHVRGVAGYMYRWCNSPFGDGAYGFGPWRCWLTPARGLPRCDLSGSHTLNLSHGHGGHGEGVRT